MRLNSDPAVDNMYAQKLDTYFGQTRTEIGPLLPERASRVLEIGCGDGSTMRWVRGQRSIDYAVGIEMDPLSAAKAASAFDAILTGNVEEIDLPNEQFDLIIILDVLEHLLDPWRLVQRLQSLLADGGALIASIPNVGHYSVCLSLLRGHWNYTASGLLDKTHLRFFTRQTSIDLMSSAVLSVDKTDRTYDSRLLQHRSKIVRWYVNKIINLLVPEHLFAFQFLIRSIRIARGP